MQRWSLRGAGGAHLFELLAGCAILATGLFAGHKLGYSRGVRTAQLSAETAAILKTSECLLRTHACSAETCGGQDACPGLGGLELDYVKRLIEIRSAALKQPSGITIKEVTP